MSDIQSGENFIDGQAVTGARLNNAVNGADLQPGYIDDRTLVSTPNVNDKIPIFQNSTGTLKKTTVGAVGAAGAGVTSVGLNMPTGEFNVSGPNPIVATGTWNVTFKQGNTNKTLATPADGTLGLIALRARDVRDQRFNTQVIPATSIDWLVTNNFFKGITADTTFSFLHSDNEGLSILVAVKNNGHVAHWPPTVLWFNGGAQPLPTTGTNIFKFTNINGVVYGWVEALNCQ